MDKKLKALIVEDSEEDALLVAMELKRSGYDLAFERVDTPESFAAVLDAGAWDVILCDYSMPRFSGSAALEILRGKGLDIPFIIVSGSIGEETAVALMKAGAHDYIMKDRLPRLAPAVDRELAEAAVRRERRQMEADLREANLGLEAALEGLEAQAAEREQLNAALRESEKGLQEAQRIARLGSWDLDLTTNALTWSDEIFRIFEVDPSRFDASYEAFLDAIHPDDKEFVNAAYTRSIETETPYDIVHRLLMKDGRVKYVNERCETYFDLEGLPVRSMGTVQDITERMVAELNVRRLNRVYSVLRMVNQTIVRATDRQSLFDEICRIAVDEGLFRMACVWLVDEVSSEVKPAASAGCDEGYLNVIRIALSGGPLGMGPTGRAIREGAHFINNNTATNPAMAPWRDEALARGYHSSAAFPLSCGGRVVGSLTVYSDEAGFFNDEEVSLLDELAGDMSFALTSMEQDKRRRVAEEAIERAKLEWERTFDSITDPIMLLDANFNITRVNTAMAGKLGLPPKDAVGLKCYKAVHGLDRPHPDCPHKLLLDDGGPHDAELYEERLGGYYMISDSPLFGPDGRLCGSVHYARDVTQRKLAEEKLRLANTLVENSATMLFRWKAEDGWPVEYVSNNVVQLGYTPDELLSGRTRYSSIVHPDDLERVAAEVADNVARGVERFTQEYRVVASNGQVRWLDDRTVVERDAGGSVTHFQGIVIDITERKRAEEELRDSEEMLRSITSSAQDAIIMIGEDGCISYWNRAAERILGYSADEAIGMEMHPLIAPDRYHDAYRNGMNNFVETGGGDAIGRVLEMAAVRKDGTEIPVELSVAAVRLKGKWSAVGVLRDITQRKRAEEALKAERERFNDVLETLPVYVGIMTPDYRVSFANRVFRERFGVPDGRRCYEFIFGRTEPCEVCETFKVLETMSPHRWEWVGPDGRDYSVFDFPFTDTDGSISILEMGIDVTERKQAEEALRESEGRLRSILDAAFDGILVADAQTHRFTLGNRAICEMLGYSLDELVKLKVEDIHPPESLPDVIRQFESQLKGELTVAPDLPVKPKDGPVFYADVSTSTAKLSGRASMIGVFHDVTERKRAEAALKNEVAVTGALLEAARAASGNLVWDDVAESVAGLLLRFTGGKGVFIFSVMRDGMLMPRKAAGLPEENVTFFHAMRVRADDIGLFRHVLETGETMLLDSGSLHGYIEEIFSAPLHLSEVVASPIPVRDGTAGFVLINFDRLPADPRMVDIVEGIARQLGVAYDNSRLYLETQNKGIELARSVETLKVLSEIDKKILSTLDRDEMLKGAVSQIRRVAPADIAGVLLVEDGRDTFRFAYGWSLGLNIGDTVPFGQCSGYRTLKTGKTLVRRNLAEEADLTSTDRVLLENGIKSDIFVPIVCKGKGFGLLHVGSYRVAGFSLEDVETVENLARQTGIALENSRLITDIEEMFIAVVTAMASAIDAKSPWTKGHSERVTKYALMVAEKMGLGQKEKDDLRLGGLLHDIGKIGTYDDILNKPGRLTEEEFAAIKKHCDAGANIIGPIKQFKDIIPIVRHHHERWDGGGYPAGLKGEEIPRLARILCVADSFDSMTADRPYRPSPGREYAVAEINRCAGSQFDPEVARAFVEMLAGPK